MKKLLIAAALLLITIPAFAGKIDLGGKLGVSYWYEDYERKGYGGIIWLNNWLGVEALLNIDMTNFHDVGGYAGKIKFPLVIQDQGSLFFEVVPTLFYRYDTRSPGYDSIITVSPGLWTGVEMFALEQFSNLSFNISAGIDYSYITRNVTGGGSTLQQQFNFSIFALGVRYYF